MIMLSLFAIINIRTHHPQIIFVFLEDILHRILALTFSSRIKLLPSLDHSSITISMDLTSLAKIDHLWSSPTHMLDSYPYSLILLFVLQCIVHIQFANVQITAVGTFPLNPALRCRNASTPDSQGFWFYFEQLPWVLQFLEFCEHQWGYQLIFGVIVSQNLQIHSCRSEPRFQNF